MTLEQIIEQTHKNFEKRKAMLKSRHTSHGHDLELIGKALSQNHEAATAFVLARESQRHHV